MERGVRPYILAALLIPGSAVVIALTNCGHIRMTPDKALAFQDGLRCGMSRAEVRAWAAANSMDGLACSSLSDKFKTSQCDTGSGRTVELLIFSDHGRLISLQPGYVYDLTYLTYDPAIELCASR